MTTTPATANVPVTILSCLQGSSADVSLSDQVQTLDSRAETLMKDVLKRLDALRKEFFSC